MEVHRLEVIYQDASLFDFDLTSEERDAKKELRGPKAALSRAFIHGAQSLDTIGKLSRYERSLVRLLNNTLYQLDQEWVRKERTQPSEAIDIKPIEEDV
jgi:hypothetical protein